MTKDEKPGAARGYAISPWKAADRAAGDLRRGLPIMLAGRSGTGLLLAAERADENALAAFKQLGGADPFLLLTHTRARTLKIRLYTDEAVALPAAGFSAADLRALADPARDLANPLRGPFAGERTSPALPMGAATRLAKIAGLLPAVLAIPIGPEEEAAAQDAALLRVHEDAIAAYDAGAAGALTLVSRAKVPLSDAEESELAVFRADDGGREQVALIIRDPDPSKPVLCRLHSECLTGDILGSLKCDCGDQLRAAVRQMEEAGGGVLLYLAQEGRGIGLANKMRAYRLQEDGFDTVDANERLGFEDDERDFAAAGRMLDLLGIASVRLLTNNPRKVTALEAFGIRVAERVPLVMPANPHNAGYLAAKAKRSGHLM